MARRRDLRPGRQDEGKRQDRADPRGKSWRSWPGRRDSRRRALNALVWVRSPAGPDFLKVWFPSAQEERCHSPDWPPELTEGSGAGRILRSTTQRRIAILRTFRNPAFSNMPRVPLHKNELEVFSPV